MAQLKRATNIATILSDEGLGFVAAKLGLSRDDKADDDVQTSEIAARLRRTFERLGPLFVKFGQVMSTRRDLLPEEFCVEFAKLQANVAPFDGKVARQIIETEIGRPLGEVFSSVDDLPLAAASLAQVYGARLLDGTEVVLKVRRPDAADQVAGDLELLLWMSRQLHRLVPRYRAQQVHRLANEFAHLTTKELDFLNEVDAAMRFGKHLADDAMIRIPRIYRELSTNALIVMEKFGGQRLDRVKDAEALKKLNVDPDVLVETLIRTVAEQTFIHGLVHADLHPGNIFVLPDGKIGLIDFGMHGEISREIQSSLLRLMMHRVNGRHEEAADALLEIYETGEHPDPEGFRRDTIEQNKRIVSSNVSQYSIAQSMADESKMATKYGYCAPSGVLMFGRALLVTEGIALKFTPGLSFAEKLRPITQKVMNKRFDVNRIVQDVTALLPDLMQHVENLPKVASYFMAIERRALGAKSVGQFLAEELGHAGLKATGKRTKTFGPWLVAGILWASAAAAAILPPPVGAPLVAGISWFAVVAAGSAFALTAILLF